ncbi:hypothetical protein XAR_4140 [Xanthomonas citri pv. glycines str. 8ra]|nr:hypothetical protein XAR_4140 [Xanthomonas citri pv. glycines str. 8ra]
MPVVAAILQGKDTATLLASSLSSSSSAVASMQTEAAAQPVHRVSACLRALIFLSRCLEDEATVCYLYG